MTRRVRQLAGPFAEGLGHIHAERIASNSGDGLPVGEVNEDAVVLVGRVVGAETLDVLDFADCPSVLPRRAEEEQRLVGRHEVA